MATGSKIDMELKTKPGKEPRPTELLKATEVAEILIVDVRTVWRYASLGTLKPKRLSTKATRFRRGDVDRFIDGY